MRSWVTIALLLLTPALHPLLLPWVGVPSHLMWWIHVLPVALVAFRRGTSGGATIMVTSLVLVLVGERIFGNGIDPALMDRIFDPFVTSKRAGEGTGLGLAICRRLASAMGGTLSARNRANSGALFELRIPIHRAKPAIPPLLDGATVA